jgi:hypothetical protein
MSDSNKKAPYLSISVLGDMEGVIVQQLQQLKTEGRLPADLRIVHITGRPEGSVGVFQKGNNQQISVSGEIVSWPNVDEYQNQTKALQLTK